MAQSFITENRQTISGDHYVVDAAADNHFYNFYAGRVAEYQSQRQDDFCLVINGSTEEDNAYILPFNAFTDFFAGEYLDGQRRWVGTILPRANAICLMMI